MTRTMAERKRSNASARAAGRTWERQVAEYLVSEGWPRAERRRLAGAKDRGDIAGILGVVIECKNAARLEWAKWLEEARVEAANDGPDSLGAVWAKRRGVASPGGGYVVMDGGTFVRLLREAGKE